MEQTLQINDQQLMIKEYNNQRVVTMWDIANLHAVDTKNIRKNFASNRKYLLEGEDYFILEKTSEFAHTLSVSKEVSKKAINASKDIPIFTETGYLMMTKPMTDELSWKVQRTLINSYFKVKEIAKSEIAEVKEPAKIQDLSEINKTIELMTSMFKISKISDKEKFKLVSSLLEKAGVELPSIELSESVYKANYITLEELATRVGLYREDKTPSLEATMACLTNIGTTLDDLNFTLRLNGNGGYWFNVKFNPYLAVTILGYLQENNYPSSMVVNQPNGSVLTIPAYYYRQSENAI